MLASSVQQSELAVSIRIWPVLFLSHLGHHRALSTVPCVIHLPLPLPLPQYPLVCSLHLCLYFCFGNKFICIIFLESICKCQYTVFDFSFWLTSPCMTVSRPIHFSANGSLKWKKVKVTQFVPDSLWPCGLYSPWNSPGQNTGVGSLSLLQGIFPTQGSNPGLPRRTQILYQVSYKGSPNGSLLVLKGAKHVPISGSLHLLLSPPGEHSLQILAYLSYLKINRFYPFN